MISTYSFMNPSNAEATFVQSTRMQQFLKNIETLSCWYALVSCRRELLNKYPFDRVSVNFQVFCIIFILGKLSTSSIRVNPFMLRVRGVQLSHGRTSVREMPRNMRQDKTFNQFLTQDRLRKPGTLFIDTNY